MHRYTLLYIKWITNKVLLYITGNSAQCHVAAWMEGDFGKVVYTLLYLKWVTNKDLLYSRENSAQCHVAAWMGEGFGGEWTHVYKYIVSSFTAHLKLPQHC